MYCFDVTRLWCLWLVMMFLVRHFTVVLAPWWWRLMAVLGCRWLLVLCLLAMIVVGLRSGVAWGALRGSHDFEMDGDLQKRVDFWVHIFTRWQDQAYVIHDRYEPWRVVDVVDFDRLVERTKDRRYYLKEFQNEKLGKIVERYYKALERLAEHKEEAQSYGVFERRLLRTYQDSRSSMEAVMQGRVRLRVQKGLASTFLQAAQRAQNYLPYFEKEFRDAVVPIELTRLAFVESMFNPRALSKVGASGMWQFMPGTAKSYMLITSKLDERRSPFKAARAAADLLKSNYKALRSWPLAITAYNHGLGGVQRAVRVVGARDLSEIIKNYHYRSFGFASQNFYAEVLAAVRSYEVLVERRMLSVVPSLWHLEMVQLKTPTRVKDLEKVLGVPQDQIRELNLCIKKKTYERYASYLLPARYRLYVPRPSYRDGAAWVPSQSQNKEKLSLSQ